MAGRKGSGIPIWQRADAQVHKSSEGEVVNTPSTQEDTTEPSKVAADTEPRAQPTTDATDTREASEDQATLIQHATKFLQDAKVQNAPREAKLQFLKSKGLTDESIEQNKHILDSPQATETTSQTAPTSTPLQPRRVPPPSTSESSQQPISSRPNAPPIITYPEHLLQPQKPPPLITTSRLLNTAYVFTALAATCYGLSNYLVKPMTESLTAARHEFHSHTQTKLDELNQRLQDTVSVDPALKVTGEQQAAKDAQGAIDTASVDSDPTELFHRDFGTQTNPEDFPGRPASQTSSESEKAFTSVTETQQDRLQRLRALASDLANDSLSSESQAIHELRVSADMVKDHLEGLAYPASADGGAFGLGNGSAGFSNLYGAAKKEDEVGKMKQEIRSLKGSLLSARSFPGGGGRVSPVRREIPPSVDRAR